MIVDVFGDAAGRPDVMYIFRDPSNNRILEISQLMMDLKQGGANGKYGLGSMGTKLGYRMHCKRSRWKDREDLPLYGG